MGEIKGKTIRHNSKLKDNDTIDIPEELIHKNKHLELSIDTMYVDILLFFTSISHELYYRTAQYLPSKHKKYYIQLIKEIISIHKFGEFNIKRIHCDQVFINILQDFANDNNIQLICAPSQAHVPRSDRNIRTMKERVRSLFHNLPYCGLPKIIMKCLVIQTIATLNYFLARYGLLQYYGPRIIMQQRLITTTLENMC